MEKWLYYDSDENVMFDADGITIPEIFEWVTPNDLYLFKYKKETMEVINNEREEVIVMVYPNTRY